MKCGECGQPIESYQPSVYYDGEECHLKCASDDAQYQQELDIMFDGSGMIGDE